MCGRYYRQADKQAIAEQFAANVYDCELQDSYNIAPQSTQPVIRVDDESGERELAMMRWGLVPFWSKSASGAKIGASAINAKSETITTSALYREAFMRRRCLVPASGFYEWKKLDAKHKQPFAIRLKDAAVFALAGIWETWKDKATQQKLETYSILTTEANELTAAIHERMPVILPRRDYERWLTSFDAAGSPVDLLRPYPAEEMIAWPIGAEVGNARNDSPNLLRKSAVPVEASNGKHENSQTHLLFDQDSIDDL